MAGITDYLASKLKALTPEKWDGLIRSLDARFRVLEEQLGIERRVTESILQRGLQVIEDGIGPAIIAAEQAAANIAAIADLGMVFTAPSTTAVQIGTGSKAFTIPASRRAQFAPAAIMMAYAGEDYANAIIGTVASYNRQTGVLNLAVLETKGSGTHSAWTITPVATTADLEALRDAIILDRAAVQTLRNTAVEAAGTATGAAGVAVGAKTDAQAALNAFNAVWYGARDTAPEGAALGSQFLDTAQTPNVVKVLTESGWEPTVTVSVGGSRQQIYTATAGQTGPFVVDGGFSIGSVNLNGIELFHGAGVTLDPDAGTFTFSSALSAGDLVVFRGYLANDAVDVYTKAEANALLDAKAGRDVAVRADGVQAFTPAEAGQARANIDAGILSGFRNKIINGDFRVRQRGGSFAAASGARYTADRWILNASDGKTAGIEFGINGTDSAIAGVSHEPFATITLGGTNGADSLAALQQKIEGVETLGGRRATLTAWIASSVAGRVTLEVAQSFGTGGSPQVVAGRKEFDVGVGWNRCDLVVDIPSTAGKTVGLNNYLEVNVWLSSGATFADRSPIGAQTGVRSIARVSLVEGDATHEADPFSPRHIQQELALCQRYCLVPDFSLSCTTDHAGNVARARMDFKTVMRAVPSVVGWTASVGTLAIVASTQQVNFAVTGVSVGTGILVSSGTLDAEL